MTDDHKKQIAELKFHHQQEILDAVDDVRRKYEQTEKHIRDAFTKDREGCIEKERLTIRERYEKQIKMDQENFEKEKLKLLNDLNNEKERFMNEIKEKEENYEKQKELILKEHSEEIEHLKNDFNEKFKSQENKHQTELASVQEQFEHDFSIWKREHETITKRREVEREDAIRAQCRMERDRQIDSIIAKVDVETIKNQQEYDIKMNRLKEKYECEIRELEKNEEIARERFSETRNKLAECEAMIQNHQSTIKQLEIELNHKKRVSQTKF